MARRTFHQAFRLTPEEANQLTSLAQSVNRTKAALVRELVLALLNGAIKIPQPSATKEVYK